MIDDATRPPSGERPDDELPVERRPERIGPYEIRGELGRGGMGVVYRARDLSLGRDVALKVLHSDSARELRERFLREGRAGARLRHPNIVAVHAAGEADGYAWLAQDLVEGRTLADTVRAEPLDPPGTARVVAAVARALAHAHASGIVHRDVKPGNILLDAQGEPHLADFGLARDVEGGIRLSNSGQAIGTPAYMAPEQATGRLGAIDARTDVWACGVVGYECLTGRLPFVGETALAVLSAVVSDDPAPLRAACPGVPADFETILATCLEKDPGARYASATALAEDCERFLRGEPIAARRAGPLYRWRKRLARHPLAWGLGLTAAALAIAGTATAVVLARRGTATSAELGRTSAALDVASRELTLAELAKELEVAYLDLSLQTLHPMQRLEDHWHGARLPDAELDVLLGRVEAAADAIAKARPGVRLPRAWAALARSYAGIAGAHDALVAAAAEAGDDPFPHICLARVELAEYARGAALPDLTYGLFTRPTVAAFRETAAMRAARERAGAALHAALARPVWQRLRRGDEVRRFAEGAAALGRGEMAAAATALLAVADDPLVGAEARNLRALACFCDRQSAEAARTWETLRERGWTDALLKASHAREWRAWELRATGGDPLPELALAQADAEAVRRLAPRDPRGLERLGSVRAACAVERRQRGEDPMPDFRAALEALDAVIQAAPAYVITRINRGNVHAALAATARDAGRDPGPSLAAAEADYLAATEADAADAHAWANLAAVRKERADLAATAGGDAIAGYEAALRDLERAIAVAPGFAGAHSNRGATLHALALAQVARGIDPMPALESAETAYADAVAAAPGDTMARYNRGVTLLDRARIEEAGGRDPIPTIGRACADFDAVLGVDPRNVDVLLNRGAARLRLGDARAEQAADGTADWQAARADFDAALTVAPRTWQALANRAQIRQRLGDHAGALGDLEAAVEIRPDVPALRQMLDAARAGGEK